VEPQPTADVPAGPVPYSKVTHERYAQAFADACQVVEARRGVVLQGRCPRCGDAMSFPHLKRIFMVTVPLASPAISRADPEVVPMLCTCQDDHPGRPGNGHGCGAYWNIRLRRSQP
jgi:hypothetical protein